MTVVMLLKAGRLVQIILKVRFEKNLVVFVICVFVFEFLPMLCHVISDVMFVNSRCLGYIYMMLCR